jgi:hypothetical protein
METVFIPQNYDEWHHYITVVGKQTLTLPYIEKRIEALGSSEDPTTARFVQLYGEQQRLNTINWFEQAKKHTTST